MCTQKSDSIIRETLKSLCCNYGWCYGIFWGFDKRNSLILTLKDAYHEEQMGMLVDSMLLQVHVLGGGVIGQAAFTKNHQWMYSDAHHERNRFLESFQDLEVFQDDSEFYCQFSMGIKTIALISVEPWGVVQFGSTQKNPETKNFVDQVKELFRGMDKHQETEFFENEPPSDSQFFDSNMQFSSLLSYGVSDSLNQNLKHGSESGNFFDSSATQAVSNSSDCSVVISSWPHLTSKLEENGPFSRPRTYESCNFTSLLEELSQESDFLEAISKDGGLDDDLSQWFSPQLCSKSTPFTTTLLTNDLSLSSLSGNNSPIHMLENFPTNSMQSSLTEALRSNHEVICRSDTPGIEKMFDSWGVETGCKEPLGWSETLIPVANGDEFNFSTDKYVGSTSNSSLFSKLGLDQFLHGGSSCSLSKSEDQLSSAAKRRRKTQSLPSFSPGYNTETRNIELNIEATIKETGSCIGDSCSIGPRNSSSSKGQEEHAKMGKKKVKPGTRPRPKDRQMIQDRLAELRELIPNGQKMSIDRLLERTIRHLNFMQGLTKHAECLKQFDKPKVKQSSNSGGGVTWACEVGDQTMVCPLIVEDLSTPGQMVIEIVCEEHGFFLEILDIIRGFGLIVLKGVMEVRETKIWAHFIVEAEGTHYVTRHEIFSSLIQLLQMTGQNAANANDSFDNVVISSGTHLFSNCQAAVSFPVNLAESLQCANL